MLSNYQNLTVRQKSIELTKEIYNLTKNFPQSELYGIVNQMRRSSVSIPSNIAEGNQRNTDKEYAKFLYIAKGSAAELETQIIIAHQLGFILENDKKILINKIQEILKMLSSFISTINKTPKAKS